VVKRGRLCFVTAAPLTVDAFLGSHIDAATGQFDVTVFSNFGAGAEKIVRPGGVSYIQVPFARKPSPVKDLHAFLKLLSLMRANKCNVLVSVTPKAGLIAMVIGKILRVDVRIHWFTGQVWADKRGLARRILKASDKVISRLATHVLADSGGQRDFLISEGVVSPEQITVLAHGSISGVDSVKFQPDCEARARIRRELAIPDSSVVTVFLGRVTRAKGVFDLTMAYSSLNFSGDHCLLVVGADEEGLITALQDIFARTGKRLIFVGSQASPQGYLAAADLICLPSHREGFGTAVIESAAVGLPSIVSDIYGLKDAVAHGETGLVVPIGDVQALAVALMELHHSSKERLRLGQNAMYRARRFFSQGAIAEGFSDYVLQAVNSTKV